LSFGLGFVLSFGYWCTNFLVVQRAMAARNMSAARRTPLIAAVPKMIFPILVILPGMIAAGLAITAKDGYHLPPKTLDSAIYAKAIPAVQEAAAKHLDAAAAAQLVSDAAGVKMLPDKIDALVKAAPTLNDKEQSAICRTQWRRITMMASSCPSCSGIVPLVSWVWR
jgi:SSS family solute:Na+ symporter